jgi:tetratricopeptide (TPR) repeat protein
LTGGVFINYRSKDSGSYAALLYLDLSRRFGEDMVFLDSESIPAGADFAAQLLSRVRRCRVLLAVIGPRWLVATDGAGRPIDKPADWVRRELAEALSAGVRVIPVLTDGASMPAEGDLPTDIAALGRCQYRWLRHREATADLERLHTDLATDPRLPTARSREMATSPTVVPAQLPADIHGFAGRAEQLSHLDALLRSTMASAPTAVVISAVSGTAGVGKTTLAVHWAHQVAPDFPDGQLYVNLRGFDRGGRIMQPAAALHHFLTALGVPPERIPLDVEARTALYRSLLSGKRVLVVLDNARDAGHARPLLPGTPTALVVVTSRDQLLSLVAADGAHPVTLDLLSTHEAHELLAHRIGAGSIAAEPGAAGQIVKACARLPLALALVAARAATHPTFSLSALAAELSRAGEHAGRTAAGSVMTQVRTVFSWSYAALTPAAARFFRLMGLHPGPDISAAAARSLNGTQSDDAQSLLAELTGASLLVEREPGRFGYHDLLAAYAADLAHHTDTDEERLAATARLLDHYVHTAYAADRLLYPARDPSAIPLGQPAPGSAPERLVDSRAAVSWLAFEHRVLLAALRLSESLGFDDHTWQLAWAMTDFLLRQGHWHDLASTWGAALAASSRQAAHPAAVAHAYRRLAWAESQLGDYEQSQAHLQRAMDFYVEIGDLVGQAHAHRTLALLWERRDRPDQALSYEQEAIVKYRSAGHRRGEANALNHAGRCHALLGEHVQALDCCRQALALHEQACDRWGEANSWDGVGYALFHLVRLSEAISCCERALALYGELGARYNEATTLHRIGDAHQAAGEADAARVAWTRAAGILLDLAHPEAEMVDAKLAAYDRPHGPK